MSSDESSRHASDTGVVDGEHPVESDDTAAETVVAGEADGVPQLWSCDACINAVFTNEAQLLEHITSRHRKEIFPDYQQLASASSAAQAQWEKLQALPPVMDKLRLWGEKAFRLAKQRDGGEEKMKEAHAARAQLEVAVQRWLPSCKVYIFGSSVALGVWDGTSDIDYTVVDVGALERGTWNPNEKSAVRSIAHVLLRAGFTTNSIELIPYARVPIIKHHATTPLVPPVVMEAGGKVSRDAERVVARTGRFLFASPASPQDRVLIESGLRAVVSDAERDIERMWWDRKGLVLCVTFSSTVEAMRALTTVPATTPSNRCTKASPLHEEYRPELFHMDFDLSFRVFGVRNSVLLRQYLLAHPCGRPGSLVLKDWSKTSGVNNSMGGFLTSYAINILWIYYLVRRGFVPYIDPLDIPSSLASPVHMCDPKYAPMEDTTLSASARERQYSDMGSLLVDFFRFYACEFNWKTDVVSLNRYEVTTKAQLGWDHEEVQPGRKHTRYELCIEDPYEENLNLGRHLGPTKAKKVLQEFHRGFLSLIKDNANESCVFEMTDNANTEVPLPPAAALIKLLSVVLVAFEEKSLADEAATTTGEANSSTPPLSVTWNSSELQRRVEKEAPIELQMALKCWTWQQLLHRLGYKCVGGVVYRRRQYAVRSKPPSSSSSSTPSSSFQNVAVDRVRELLLQRLAAVAPTEPLAQSAGVEGRLTKKVLSCHPQAPSQGSTFHTVGGVIAAAVSMPKMETAAKAVLKRFLV